MADDFWEKAIQLPNDVRSMEQGVQSIAVICSKILVCIIFRCGEVFINELRMRIQRQKLLIKLFIIFEFQQWIFHLFVRHGASSFLHPFSEHSAHDFHALWVERMSGTLAEDRGDLGVRLAPAAVAVGEVGHSEDAGQ